MVAAAILLTLTGCEAIAETATTTADRLRDAGHITQEEHAALTGGIWGTIVDRAITVGTGVLLSLIGVQRIRGTSATQDERAARKAAKKAKKDPVTGA